ncbi:MAG: hypothetical protein GTO45_32400 [Candidatus Aminicenantes bacterium]|nr:hypothetical protein [Candidatus Aminicenantes bacterium]NIM83452.1 hypothetical protein [Candidatus Aminicenantes bacterium]NIN22844.1 hypothetical protein [Candidatus Aminicenantes bacterium]NIN46580.1 hypothetical protein [Candidatus Aminicenantes bacterium]NIN89483.1 hypothetical protein [Candidatus Aminicenantes bacterium]
MNDTGQLCVKLVHCGNMNIANPMDTAQKNTFFLPMGLFSLADILVKHGVDAEIIHLDIENKQTIEEILDFSRLDAVGFDLQWINQGVVVLDTIKLIKKIRPEIFVFLGGFSASLFADEIISDYPDVDVIIKGDSEIPIVELCMAVREGKGAFNKVQNLVWRDHRNNIRQNAVSYVPSTEELENIDFASVDLLRNWLAYKAASSFWTRFSPINTSPLFFLEVGRGCPYACTFCGGNCVAQDRINNRRETIFRSAASVIGTIKKAISFGFETFFACMESEVSDEWYLQLFKRISEEKLSINFVYGSWGLPCPSFIDALSDACNEVIIEISPETSDLALRKKNKDPRLYYSNEELEKCLDYISSKQNIKVQLYFGYYLAGDTEKTILDTISYVLTLILKYPHLVEIEYSNFSTDPGSLFFLYPEKYGIDIKVCNFRDYVKYVKDIYIRKKGQPADMIVFKPENISTEEDAEIHKKVRLLNHLFFSYRKSISYILAKTGSPHIIVSLLKEAQIDINDDNTFPQDEIKKILLSTFSKNNILDDVMIQLISYEYERIASQDQVLMPAPTPQLYLDFEREELMRKDRMSEAMIHYINSRTGDKAKDESIDIDFDI